MPYPMQKKYDLESLLLAEVQALRKLGPTKVVQLDPTISARSVSGKISALRKINPYFKDVRVSVLKGSAILWLAKSKVSK